MRLSCASQPLEFDKPLRRSCSSAGKMQCAGFFMARTSAMLWGCCSGRATRNLVTNVDASAHAYHAHNAHARARAQALARSRRTHFSRTKAATQTQMHKKSADASRACRWQSTWSFLNICVLPRSLGARRICIPSIIRILGGVKCRDTLRNCLNFQK